jgi:hypothetical protein
LSGTLRVLELALRLLNLLVDAGFPSQVGERTSHPLQGGRSLAGDLRKTLAEHEDRDHEDHDELGEGKTEELHAAPIVALGAPPGSDAGMGG